MSHITMCVCVCVCVCVLVNIYAVQKFIKNIPVFITKYRYKAGEGASVGDETGTKRDQKQNMYLF